MVIAASNRNYTEAKKLKERKYRVREGLCLIEGEKLIRDAMRFEKEILSVFVDVKKAEKYRDITDKITSVFEMEQRFIDNLSETVTPQGIVAVMKMDEKKIVPPTGSALILETVQDPSNVGAILRTAAAAGYNDVYLCGCADPYSMKCFRAGMSAQFILNVMECTLDEALGANKGNMLLCADMKGDNVFTVREIPVKHTLIMGSEGKGLSDKARQSCNGFVSLEMENGIESLNVAVSAGILMYMLSSAAK